MAPGVTERAICSRERWVVALGTPPSDPIRRELWYLHLDTVATATYRECWSIVERDPLGQDRPASLERAAQRRLAENSIVAAMHLHREEGIRPVLRRDRAPGLEPERVVGREL